jgi:hypothetical protein
MKCPKCGYTSFDYNDSCPRCRKDIAAERHQLNLPAFTPNPPYLLGPLSGEAGARKIGIETEQMAPPPMLGPDHLAGPEDSQALQAMEMAFEADQGTQIPFEPLTSHPAASPSAVETVQDSEFEKDVDGIDLMDLSLEDLEPPSSLSVEVVTPEDEAKIDFSSDALSFAGDELVDLDDNLLFGEDDASLDESLGQISDHASGAVFLDDEAGMVEGLEGPLDLDQLASMVESINENATPAVEGRKRSFDPSLGIEHMMEDEILDPDVTLGSRSEKEQPTQDGSIPQQRLPVETPP